MFDANTKKPLKAEVKLYDLETDVLTQYVTSDPEYGDYTVVLNEGHHYAMYASADKYLLKSLSFDYSRPAHLQPAHPRYLPGARALGPQRGAEQPVFRHQ